MIVFVALRKVSKDAIIELGLHATDDDLSPLGSKSWVVQPADQKALLSLASTVGPDELTPNSLLGVVLSGQGVSLPQAARELEEWWAEVVGTDRFSATKPRMAAFRGYETRQALPPLIAELLSPDVIDISTLVLVTSAYKSGASVEIPERVNEELEDAVSTLRWFREQFSAPVHYQGLDPAMYSDEVREQLERAADGEDVDV